MNTLYLYKESRKAFWEAFLIYNYYEQHALTVEAATGANRSELFKHLEGDKKKIICLPEIIENDVELEAIIDESKKDSWRESYFKICESTRLRISEAANTHAQRFLCQQAT
jgi:hypothetical protein